MSEFVWNGQEQWYEFETDALRGCLVPQGPFQGIHSLIHKRENRQRVGMFTKQMSPDTRAAYGDLTGKRLFLLDLYHYLACGLPEGTKGRDLSATHRALPGGVEITLEPSELCKIRTRVRYTLAAEDAIDLEIQVTAKADYRDFELWLSSYTPHRCNGAFFYVYDGPPGAGRKHFLRPAADPLNRGYYLSFPRDNHAAALTYDGRWGSGDYQTFITAGYYAEPLAVILNESTGYAYLEMARRDECCKLCGSYVDTVADPTKGNDYTPLYTVLFGRDLAGGQTLTARIRACVVRMDGDFEVPLERYREFLEHSHGNS